MPVLTRPTPTGIERRMPKDGLLISKTDPRGVISYGNRMFIGMAGYSESELIGSPHNIIRHPLMPKAAFKDLWETVQSGHEWHGLVCNLAKDGCHYWVDATVTPSFEGPSIIGYMSVRRYPDPDAVQDIIPNYRAMVAAEGSPCTASLTTGFEDYSA
jgi:PAS domain S-box-containing protein